MEENSSAEEDHSAEDCFINRVAIGVESLGSGGAALGGGLLPRQWIVLTAVDLSAVDSFACGGFLSEWWISRRRISLSEGFLSGTFQTLISAQVLSGDFLVEENWAVVIPTSHDLVLRLFLRNRCAFLASS